MPQSHFSISVQYNHVIDIFVSLYSAYIRRRNHFLIHHRIRIRLQLRIRILLQAHG